MQRNHRRIAICQVLVFSFIGLLCAHGALASQTSEQKTASTIGIENGKLSLAFDRTSGALVSLKNLDSGDEYLKQPRGDGNPFRAYVDTTEVPAVLKGTFPWPTPPVEDAMGGVLADPKQCKLQEAAFERTGNGGVLRLVMHHSEPELTFELKITVPDDDVAVNLDLAIRNSDTGPHRVMAAMPYLTGLALGKDPAQNLGINLLGFGQAGAPAWVNNGEIYGRVWTGQWNAIYDPASNEGLGLIVQDQSLKGKLFRRFPGGGMSVFYFNDKELKPGEVITYPSAQLLIHRGNWRFVARRYHSWFSSTFPVHRPPAWLDDVGMFIGPWIPTAQSVADAKQQPDSSNTFASFSQLQRLSLNDQYDLKEWAQYWESYIKSPGVHCNGIFTFRSDLGGASAFREGAIRSEHIGRHVGIYVATMSMRVKSPFLTERFPGTRPEDWLLMETPDARITEKDSDGGEWFYCCLRYKPWQDYVAALCKQLIQETGAEYIRLDEAGVTYLTCHNPAHHHANPYEGTQEMLEFYRKVRQAVDEVNPNVAIFTENPTDMLQLYCDGSLAMWNAEPEMAPMRLAAPSFVGFAYDLGQTECALQGYAPGKLSAASEAGWANGHHEKLWGPGLVAKPVSLSKTENGVGPDLRWNELRSTFAGAIKACDPTDEDPVGIGQSKGEWAARMWRSDKYWVMVCGNVAAIRPASPTRVKLPELPESITRAFEFDVQTLEMHEIPIVRNSDGIFVEVTSGFSAVLFPTPQCPPLIQVKNLTGLSDGTGMDVKLEAFSPWRSDSTPPKVSVEVPGMTVSASQAQLPASITITAPKDAEHGLYSLRITGDCLQLKRWFRYDSKI